MAITKKSNRILNGVSSIVAALLATSFPPLGIIIPSLIRLAVDHLSARTGEKDRVSKFPTASLITTYPGNYDEDKDAFTCLEDRENENEPAFPVKLITIQDEREMRGCYIHAHKNSIIYKQLGEPERYHVYGQYPNGKWKLLCDINPTHLSQLPFAGIPGSEVLDRTSHGKAIVKDTIQQARLAEEQKRQARLAEQARTQELSAKLSAEVQKIGDIRHTNLASQDAASTLERVVSGQATQAQQQIEIHCKIARENKLLNHQKIASMEENFNSQARIRCEDAQRQIPPFLRQFNDSKARLDAIAEDKTISHPKQAKLLKEEASNAEKSILNIMKIETSSRDQRIQFPGFYQYAIDKIKELKQLLLDKIKPSTPHQPISVAASKESRFLKPSTSNRLVVRPNRGFILKKP